MIVLSVGILVCTLVCALIFDLKMTEITERDMSNLVTSLAQSFDPESEPDEEAIRLSEAAGGNRITIIGADGRVLADSKYDAASMENHRDRAEIKQADHRPVGLVIRESETLGYKMMYAAKRTDDGYYIRVAGEYAGLISDLISFLPAMFGAGVLAMLAASLLAGRFAKSVSAPISSLSMSLIGIKDGSVSLNPEDYPYDELQDMAQGINRLSSIIKMNVDKLREEKDKIDYILDNMREGFVLLDKEASVLVINRSACRFFQCEKDVIGRNFLRVTRDMDFVNGLDRVVKTGEPVCFDSECDGKIMEANLYFVRENACDEYTGGVILILTDVTESRKAVAIRRDFFSNASHELKTPITSIKGFSEMLTSDLELAPEQKKLFLSRIAAETERMDALINDIILISQLESSALPQELCEQDFTSVVTDCIAESEPLAKSEGIRIQSELEPCKIMAERKDLYSLAGNLIINGMKYNRKGGRLEIVLKDQENRIFFQVFNEGETIPKEHQGRVFERFYRMDQGRTKNVGGTGLGLSIVRNVVERYRGTIELKSSREEGTTFTILLPK